MKLHKLCCLLLVLLLCLGLSACSSKPKEPTPEQVAKRDELAQEFMLEIRDKILPYRNQVGLLHAQGVFISEEEQVSDFALLDQFVDQYEAGEDCSLTVCFITKSFVVARMVMADGVGYYFRYQFDPDEPIAVTSRVFDRIRVERDESLGKARLKLEYDEKELATFTFRQKKEALPPSPGSAVG